MTSPQLGESLRGALQALYCRHYAEVTTLTCYLERQLPLREPFFQLKRVPHFQVREDLHQADAPAYTPILRLECATPEDVALRGRAGCRRVLVEGDLGTGKTFLCYQLLQMWAGGPRSKCQAAPALGKGARPDDISTFQLVLYVDCVRLPASDYLGRCSTSHKRYLYVLASALKELLTPADCRLGIDSVYHWLEANQSDVCVIYDNLDGSDLWLQLVGETLKEREGPGKVVVCATPGRVAKNIDSLFYCYGLHPDYSVKLVISKLRRISADLEERAAIPKSLDPSQELLRNPLTQSLLATYLRHLTPSSRPLTHFDLIEGLVASAMAGDSFPLTQSDPVMLPSTASNIPPGSPAGSPTPASLMSICETVAFECLESDTNYFCKFKLPAHFWSKHLCDCRILHEVHDVGRQGRPVVSFTSRCVRDYLASRRLCRYLLSERDRSRWLQALVSRRQLHAVVKFCIRQLAKLGRLDTVQTLLEKLMAEDPKRWLRSSVPTLNSKIWTPYGGTMSRGRLAEHGEVLSWLRQADFEPQLLALAARRFPDVLDISFADCPAETLQDFVAVTEKAADQVTFHHVVISMDGLYSNFQLGLRLARCLNEVPGLTSLTICLRCVTDTGFVVNFLCEVFEDNDHLSDLTLEGPFNSSENLTPAMHRRVRQVFCLPGTLSLSGSLSDSTAMDPLGSGGKVDENTARQESQIPSTCRVDHENDIDGPYVIWEKRSSRGEVSYLDSSLFSDRENSPTSATFKASRDSINATYGNLNTTRLSSEKDLAASNNESIRSPEIPPSPWETPNSPVVCSTARFGGKAASDDISLFKTVTKLSQAGDKLLMRDTDKKSSCNLNIVKFTRNDSSYKSCKDTQTSMTDICQLEMMKQPFHTSQTSIKGASHCGMPERGTAQQKTVLREDEQLNRVNNNWPVETRKILDNSKNNATSCSSAECTDVWVLREALSHDVKSVCTHLKSANSERLNNNFKMEQRGTDKNSSRTDILQCGANERPQSPVFILKRPNLLSSVKSRLARRKLDCVSPLTRRKVVTQTLANDVTSTKVSVDTPMKSSDSDFNGSATVLPAELDRVGTLRDMSTRDQNRCTTSRCCSAVVLQNLCLEHINYHHRVAYFLRCWPDIFHKLEIRKCNLNTAGAALADKVRDCRHLTSLVLEHCHVTPAALRHLLLLLADVARGRRLPLRVLGLNLLSSSRHFSRCDARKPAFRPALSLPCCQALVTFLTVAPSLQELALRHDGLDDPAFRLLVQAVALSPSLTSLDLTGNLLGDGAQDDVVALVLTSSAPGGRLRTLYLHENSFSPEVRLRLVESCVNNDDVRLSL